MGKSKLAVDLAHSLSRKLLNAVEPWTGADVINADSMQVYVGMDVITNKVPVEERRGIEHLLMDYKRPGEQLTGPEWIKDAIEAVSVSATHLESGALKWVVRSRRPTKETKSPS